MGPLICLQDDLTRISHRQAKLEQERREKEEEEARQRRLLEEQRARQREEEEREAQARLRAAQEKAQEEERRRRQEEEEKRRREEEERKQRQKEEEEEEERRKKREEQDRGGRQPPTKLTVYRALYPFVARNADELSVDADCLIEVRRRAESLVLFTTEIFQHFFTCNKVFSFVTFCSSKNFKSISQNNS